MSDIVERLLAPSYWMSGSKDGHEGENDAPREAAAEITRLRSELATARKDALEEAAKVAEGCFASSRQMSPLQAVGNIASAIRALGEE